MAKLSAHGRPFLTYFHARRRALLSVHPDGTTLFRTPFQGWKVLARKKAEVPLEQWKESKRRQFEAQPHWAKDITKLPSQATIEHWMMDGVAETVEGDDIEPDGIGANGSPSWLLALGLI